MTLLPGRCRYNLKRKVAGLPAVTKEWFDARKAQLSSVSTTGAAPGQKVWLDPLTKKKFMSENTYQAHVRSKKYQDLVRASGAPAPAPVVTVRAAEPAAGPSGEEVIVSSVSKAMEHNCVALVMAGF